MRQNAATVEIPTPGSAGEPPLSWSTHSLLPSLFAIAGLALRPGREERQLASVIHQLHWNEKARHKLFADPDAFIECLKVLPQVKAVLSMMKATLLAGRVMSPEFNWWWGVTDPDPETGRGERAAGGESLPSDVLPVALPSFVG
jgi:hypothetical protein